MEPNSTSFPVQEFFGFQMEKGDGRATATLTIDARHLNPNGVAHGSVAFALMDTAMGAAVMSVAPEGHYCATVEMHTRFHSGVTGGGLHCEAVVISPGKRIMHLEAKTHDDRGRLVASATSSFAVLPIPTR